MLVKYIRNADPSNATGAIKFNSDDRDDLVIGGQGEVTDEEFALLSGLGYVLEATEDGLGDLNKSDLQNLATSEGVDTKDSSGKELNKEDLLDAVRAARAAGPATPDESVLPATATSGVGGASTVVAGGAGSAAGPEGAAGSPDAGGGPATTTGGGA